MSNRRGLMLVISSPSGAGKTSLAKRLIQEHADLGLSVSATTRAARPGELDGREYHFVSQGKFEEMVREGAFLEWAEVHEHLYGSPRAPILERLAAGKDVLFDIDWQGARAIKEAASGDTVSVFILPPTLAALEKRLRSRAQDADPVIIRRLARAHGEIAMYANYEYVLVNDDFDAAYAKLSAIYVAERERRVRNPWLDGFVARLLSEG